MDKKLIKSAKKLYKSGEFAKAGILFERGGDLNKAVEAYDKSRQYLDAARISSELGRGEDIAKYYLHAKRYDLLAVFYEDRKDYLRAGQYFSRSGDYKNAAEMYEIQLKKYPVVLNITGSKKEMSPEQIRDIRLAASLNSKAENYERAAELYASMEAFEEEAKNLKLHKDFRLAGEAYIRAGLPSDAGHSFAEGNFFEEAAQSFIKAGDLNQAGENYYRGGHLLEAGEQYGQAGDFFSASDVFSEAGELDKAIKILTRFDPDSGDYRTAVERITKISHKKGYLSPPAKRYLTAFVDSVESQEHLALVYDIAMLFHRSEYGEESLAFQEKIEKINPNRLLELRKTYKKAYEDDISTTDYEAILEQDFQASRVREKYEKRQELLDVKKKGETGEETIARDLDDTINSGDKAKTPASFLHIQEGQKFGDRYLILEHLGSGGMGSVYKSQDLELDELVAIKILSQHQQMEEQSVARFKQEIKLARQIVHPNVIRIFDLGEQHGMKFITMEYFRSEQIKVLISENTPFQTDVGLDIALQICAGLTAAHKKGIIHRDIKSQNIMVDTDGNVKILDFGIAKSGEVGGLTTDGSVLGTPEYISPEAIMQKSVDARSDIYSLGIVLFEMFTGYVPFSGDSIMGIIRQHLYDDIPDPRTLNEDIPEDLAEIILQCLERDPDDRYFSVAELTAELKAMKSIVGKSPGNTDDTRVTN